MSENLYAFLRQGFADRLQQVCLELPDGSALRYRELDELSARYAAVLDGLGLAPGDRIVTQVDKFADTVALYLGCLRLGIVYVPLNTAYTEAELEYFLADAEPRLLIVRPEQRESLATMAAGRGIAIDSLGDGQGIERQARNAAPRPELASLAADDVVVMVYTSGTTGRSKGAMLTYENLASNVTALHDIWGWQRDDVLLHALPVFHVHGLIVALHCALLGGSRILFQPRFEVRQLREALAEATVMMGVPTFYTRLLDEPDFGSEECSGMRLFICGSAPLLAETFEAFAARSGHRILERYGMTEAGMITSNPLRAKRLAGTVGYPLPGVELRVVDEQGACLPAGEIGAVEIRGPNVFKGYWRQPEKTAAEFCADGFFRTGDLGQLSADGRLSLVGRSKDLIISGGYNIYPKEIETCLNELPGIRESAVIGVPHADLGEVPIAVIVPEDSRAADERDILAALESRLARFKRPRHIVSVDALPRNALGKVQKQQLRETYAGLLR